MVFHLASHLQGLLLLITTCSLSRAWPASHLGQYLPLLSFLRAVQVTCCCIESPVWGGSTLGSPGKTCLEVGCHQEKVLKEGLQPSVPWSMAVLIWTGLPRLAAAGGSGRTASAQPNGAKLSLEFWCQGTDTCSAQTLGCFLGLV